MQSASRRTIRRVGSVRGGLVAAAVMIVASGCSSTPPADEAVASAVDAVDRGNSGRFVHSLETDGVSLVRSEGDYDLDARVSSTTTVVDSGEGEAPVESAVVVVDDRRFSQPDVAAGPCWISAPASRDDLVPAAVRPVFEAQGQAWISEGVSALGATSMRALLDSLGALGAEVGFGTSTIDRQVDTTVHLQDGEFVALNASMADLVDAVRDSGVEVPAVLEPFGAKGLEVPVLVGVSEVGKKVSVVAPDADLVVSKAKQLVACNARASK